MLAIKATGRKPSAQEQERACKHAANAVRVPRHSLEAAMVGLPALPASTLLQACFALHPMWRLGAVVIIRAGACRSLLPETAQGRAARLFQPVLAPRCSPATPHM